MAVCFYSLSIAVFNFDYFSIFIAIGWLAGKGSNVLFYYL